MGWTLLATAAGIIAVWLCAWLFLVFPCKPEKQTRAPFQNSLLAHRGLYGADQNPPENTLPAFAAAAEAGYGIELDVQLTRDGEVVVFHDDYLNRACGTETRVDAYTLAELRGMPLFGSGETMPLFSQVLAEVNGRVPLLVELKTGPRNAELCEKTLALLKDYGGDYCIESFDPRIIAWFRRHAPEILRGQLSQQYCEYRGFGFGRAKSFLLSRCLLNCIARPGFIAYRTGKRPVSVNLALQLGAMHFAWTVREQKYISGCDAAIFEHFTPEKKGNE